MKNLLGIFLLLPVVVMAAETVQTPAPQAPQATSTAEPTLSGLGWEISTNVLGYSLSPIAARAYDMTLIDVNLTATYALGPEHQLGLEPTFFSLNPASRGAALSSLISGVSDFNVQGVGFAPVYRWYEAGFDNATSVFGLRVPIKFLTLNTTNATTGTTGSTSFAIIQFLAELGYRFKWDVVTLTPGAFVGYRLVTLDSSFVVNNTTHSLGSNATNFLDGLGYGAQLSLGVAF